MNKEILLKKIKTISKNFGFGRSTTEEDLLNLEELMLEYLKENPKDTEMWLRVTMLEYTPPLEDPDSMIKYLNNILSYDPINPYALLVLLYTYDFYYGKIPDTLFKKIENVTYKDNEIAAMIEIAKSWYYSSRKNGAMYEQSLLRSIELSSDFSRPYINLGMFYVDNGIIDKGKELILKGISNIREFYNEENLSVIEDLTDIQRFLDYYYKGLRVFKDKNIASYKDDEFIKRYLDK